MQINKNISNRLVEIADCFEKCNQLFAVIGRWAVIAMLGLGFWNVIGRYFGAAIGHNLSSNTLIEAQWYLFDLIFLLGIGWTLQRQAHVRVDIFQSRLKKRHKIKIEFLGTLFLLLPFALGITVISIQPAMHSWFIQEASPDPNGLPRYWIKTLIPLGFLLLSLQGFSEAIHNWIMLKTFSKKNISQSNNHLE